MKIIFLGAGDIAVELLLKMTEDPQIQVSAIGVDVKNYNSGKSFLEKAKSLAIPQITGLNELDDYSFDFIFMINYPSLIKRELLNKYLFINVHYALLPRFRGFHGFMWSLINGEKEVGFSVHQVNDGIDDGPVYYQYKTEYQSTDNGNSVIVKLNNHLVYNINNILYEIALGKQPVHQEEKDAIFVCRRKPEDGLIDWNLPAERVHDLIRALTPPLTPGAFTFYRNSKIIIISSSLIDYPSYYSKTGQITAIKENGILVKCVDKCLYIKDISVNDRRLNSRDYFKKVGGCFNNG